MITASGIKARGFASMSPEKRAFLGRKGGKASQATGKPHKWTHDEASAAGRVGGRISRKRQFAGIDVMPSGNAHVDLAPSEEL